MRFVLAGISWDPNIRGALVVLTAIVLLPGTVYMVLATDTGARLGLLLALTGLFGWMSIMGMESVLHYAECHSGGSSMTHVIVKRYVPPGCGATPAAR